MKKFIILPKILLVSLLASFLITGSVIAQNQPVVHAVLFYSPSCGHCHKVITEDLPPLIEEYGEQLMILGIDVSIPEGQSLYVAMHDHYELSEDQYGVPALVVDDVVLIGSLDIPQRFPEIIANGLESGGIPWPPIPGLAEILAQVNSDSPSEDSSTTEEQSEQNSIPTLTDAQEEDASSTQPSVIDDGFSSNNLTIAERFQRDLAGNIIAVLVLIFMVGMVSTTTYRVFATRSDKPVQNLSIWVPILSIVGLFVAIYLSYVEVTNSQAVCGPVGDCNTVQQSEYAKLFGILPIGVLGVIGYILIIAGYLVQRFASGHMKENAIFLVWGFSLFGVLFSIYLTFLEPFVIGATCAWCLSSAIIMTLLLIVTTPQAKAVFNNPKSA